MFARPTWAVDLRPPIDDEILILPFHPPQMYKPKLVFVGEASQAGAEVALDTLSANESSAAGPSMQDQSAPQPLLKTEATSGQANTMHGDNLQGTHRSSAGQRKAELELVRLLWALPWVKLNFYGERWCHIRQLYCI